MKVEAKKSGFGLDSKSDVELRKVGADTPISCINDCVARLNNDSAAILKLVQRAYEEFAEELLAKNENVPWQLVTKDADDKEVLSPFDGFLLDGDRLKNFNLTVLSQAKWIFGYPEEEPTDKYLPSLQAWPSAKKLALEHTRAMLLSNQAALAALQK